ncbi:MAG: hypothetical protein OXR66_01405 [Candidatus Woesearchaeota archaeon]|nr:hypothetical protein [Candidatus Woesearchaeota archaeon]
MTRRRRPVVTNFIALPHRGDPFYDEDIRKMAGHSLLHAMIADVLPHFIEPEECRHVLELGTGTGITTGVLLDYAAGHMQLYTGIESDEHAIRTGLRRRLQEARPLFQGRENIVHGDYTEVSFQPPDVDMPIRYNLAAAVIGPHHQPGLEAKGWLLTDVFENLDEGGVLLYGDFMEEQTPEATRMMQRLHIADMKRSFRSVPRERLVKWAGHHLTMNKPSGLNDQVELMTEIGYTVYNPLKVLTTTLLVGTKGVRAEPTRHDQEIDAFSQRVRDEFEPTRRELERAYEVEVPKRGA